MTGEPVIVFDRVSKSYPLYHHITGGVKHFIFNLPKAIRSMNSSYEVLRDVSFNVQKGETFGIIGKNGAGKSTTLGIMAGVIKQSSGHVEVRGRISPLLALGGGFHPELSGRENIMLNGVLLGLTRAEVTARMAEIIEFSELSDFMDQPLRTYSSGMFARLGFSVVAHLDPEILLIDEILAVGDIDFQKKCFLKMEEFKKKGVTIVIVTHSLGDVETICDRAMWIEGHEAKMIEGPGEVVARYKGSSSNGAGGDGGDGGDAGEGPASNLFEGHEAIDTKKHASRLFSHGRSRPVMVICETVNSCTNDCVICAYGKMTRPRSVMPMETFEKFLADYSAMGGGALSLTPVVGDVFLDDFLMERIAAIRKHELITSLSFTTNAVASDRLTDEELKFVLDNTDRVHISVYGIDDEEYSAMTRRDHYERTVRNIKRIMGLSADKGRLRLGFRFLKKRDEGEVQAWLLENFGALIPYTGTNRFANWGAAMDTTSGLPFSAEWLEEKTNRSQCLIPLVACQVFADGGVSFCHCDDYDATEELSLGNIAENTLIDLYNSEKARSLWDFEHRVPDFCRKCSFHIPLSELPRYESAFENPLDFIGG